MINAITPVREFAGKQVAALGKSVAQSQTLRKVNNAIEANGISLATGAFVAIVASCVLIPRLITARDADERREIFTRDFVTVLVMLFAMKGLKGIFSNTATKAKGLVLTAKEKPDEKMNLFQKFVEYFKPIGGASALSARQLQSKYGLISDKATLENTAKYIDSAKGNLAKAFSIDKSGDQKLYKASKDVLGENFETLNNKTIVEKISNKDTAELEPMLRALEDENNVFVKSAKRINAILEAGALGIVVLLLGFGLPEINRRVTNKIHGKTDDTFENEIFSVYGKEIKTTANEKQVFKNFM